MIESQLEQPFNFTYTSRSSSRFYILQTFACAFFLHNVFGNVNYNESLSDELAELLFGKLLSLWTLGDIAGHPSIRDITETEGIILRHGEDPIIKRIENDNDTKVDNDDVLITCYRSYAHPQEGVLVYKYHTKIKLLFMQQTKKAMPAGIKNLLILPRGCNLLIHDAQYTTEDYMDSFAPKQGIRSFDF